MNYSALLIICLSFTNTLLHAQSFIAVNNDTINVVDSKGQKQGLWILKDENEMNRMRCHYIDNIVSSDILYFDKNHLKLIFKTAENQNFTWIYFRTETDTLYGKTAYIDSKFTFLNDHDNPIEEDLRKELNLLSEVNPMFYGGDQQRDSFLINSIVYPNKALKKGKTGKVFVQFTIDQNGNVTGTKVVHSDNELFNEEAVRVISSMPPWQPAHQRGKMVRVRMTIPINFNI